MVWYGVRENHFLQSTCVYTLVGRTAHYAVAGQGTYAACTFFLQQISSLGDCSGCIYHIINENDISTLNITDYIHVGNLVGLFAGLVAHDHGTVEVFGIGGSTFAATYVGTGNDKIFQLQ